MIKTPLILLSALFFSACSTINVSNDFDPAFSFDTVKSYALLYKSNERSNTLTDERIKSGIDMQLRQRGYSKVNRKDADIYVVFHTNVQNKTKIVQGYEHIGISPYRYGYRYGYGYGGMMAVPTTRTYNYDEGKLLIDILNTKDNKIVWRGVATDSLKDLETPEDRVQYIREVMTSIFKSLPSKK